MLGSIEPVSHDYVSFHMQGRIAIGVTLTMRSFAQAGQLSTWS